MPEEVSLALAFGAGLLSFLSPCVLPLVPVYLASLYGPEIFDQSAGTRRLAVFLHSLSFVAGFSIVFTMLGAGAGFAGFALGANIALTRKISGSLLIALGLFMVAAMKIPWLNFEKRLGQSRITPGYLRSLLTGGIFSLAWTPCVGPILGGILAFAMSSETAGQGAYLLAVYSLGMSIPFLVVGALFDSAAPLLKRLHRYSSVFYIISAAVLLVMGILVLTNKLTWFQVQFGG